MTTQLTPAPTYTEKDFESLNFNLKVAREAITFHNKVNKAFVWAYTVEGSRFWHSYYWHEKNRDKAIASIHNMIQQYEKLFPDQE